MSKVRRFMSRWQQVFIWIVAIAFVAGIALWALATNFSTRGGQYKRTLQDTFAYLTVDGKAVEKDKYWIFPEEIEKAYGDLIAKYPGVTVDPVFEEPYVKVLLGSGLVNEKMTLYYAEVEGIKVDKSKVNAEVKKQIDEIKKDKEKSNSVKAQYGSLSSYEKELRAQIEKDLLIQAVKDKLGFVSEEEIKKHYEENKEDLVTKYTTAKTEYTVFESKEKADEFVRKAMETDFTQAASELSVTISSYDLKKGTFGEEVEKEIFESTSTLVSVPFENSYYVFKINKIDKADTFERFKENSNYQTVVDELKNKKFSENFKKWKEEKKVDSAFTKPEYDYWYKALTVEEKDMEKTFKELSEKILAEDSKLNENAPAEYLSATLVLLDRMAESTDTTLQEIRTKSKDMESDIVNNLYKRYGTSSFEVLRRLKDMEPENYKVGFEYYSKLYDLIRPYVESGNYYYVMNQLFEVYNGFGTLAEATEVAVDIRADSFYKLYEINKSLGDPKGAKGYLAKVKEIKPDYKVNFESAEKELDDMIKSMEESTNTQLEESTNTQEDIKDIEPVETESEGTETEK